MDGTGLKQRLTAILAADAVGYSRLMAVDDRSTVAALDSARAMFRTRIESNRGRVVDMAGDAVLAVFDTAAGAVITAIAVQRDLNVSTKGAPLDRRMHFRIGVHLGDVIEKADGTVYGDGVNIAARLQALAEPGGVVVSDAVHGAVRGKLTTEFVDLGEHRMKNIPHPIRAFEVRAVDRFATTDSVNERVDQSPAGSPSLAVLPFTNMSDDPAQDYFADGMVEEITTALARMRWLFVIARNSSFVYKGRAVDIKQVGRELGVRYVLEGSVRRAGHRIRITAQLIEADNGRHVWAERFEGAIDDVFELQDRITERIVRAIEPNLRRAEMERVRVKPTSNLDAYDLLLRALPGLMPGARRSGRDESLSFIRRALEKDPRYSLAKALGAFAHQQRVLDGTGTADDIRMGLRYADEALSERSDDPSVLSYAGAAVGTLGYRKLGIRVLGFRYDEAERAVERALSLSPNLLWVQFCAGNIRNCLGEGDKALAHFQHAMRLSPLDPGTSGFIAAIGAAHLVAGRYDEALAAVDRAIQDAPNFVFSHAVRVCVLARLGRLDEAKLAARQLLELSPEFSVSRYESVSSMKDPAFRRRTAEIFRSAGIPR